MHIWLWTNTESTSGFFRITAAQRDFAGSKVEETPWDRIHDIVNMDYDGTRNGRGLEIGITAWTLELSSPMLMRRCMAYGDGLCYEHRLRLKIGTGHPCWVCGPENLRTLIGILHVRRGTDLWGRLLVSREMGCTVRVGQ